MPSRSADVPPTGPPVAKRLAAAIGGSPRVIAYGDADESHRTFIMSVDGAPEASWSTHSTVTLHTAPNLLEQVDIRVELLLVARHESDLIASVLSTAAFYVIKNRWIAAPGIVFPHLISEYYAGSSTPHLLWVEPITYPELTSIDVEAVGTIHCLQGIAITEPERALLQSKGIHELDRAFEGKPVERTNLERQSLV